jgi:hypothetical protein
MNTRPLLAILGAVSTILTASITAALIPMEQVGPQPRAYSDKVPRSVAWGLSPRPWIYLRRAWFASYFTHRPKGGQRFC